MEPGSRALKVSPDARYLMARNRSQLRIIDWKADEILIKHNMPWLTEDWFTPDSKQLLSLGSDLRVLRWDAGSGKLLETVYEGDYSPYDGAAYELFARLPQPARLLLALSV